MTAATTKREIPPGTKVYKRFGAAMRYQGVWAGCVQAVYHKDGTPAGYAALPAREPHGTIIIWLA